MNDPNHLRYGTPEHTAALAQFKGLPVPTPAVVKSAKPRRRGREPGPNQTEQDYHDTYIAPRLASGELAHAIYEGFELIVFDAFEEYDERAGLWRTKPASYYLADWACWRPDKSLELHECKGKQVWEDAKIKFTAVAARHAMVRFAWARREKRGADWQRKFRNWPDAPAHVQCIEALERAIGRPAADGAEGAAMGENRARD